MNNNKHFSLNNFFKSQKTHTLFHVNPTDNALRVDAAKSMITIFQYDENSAEGGADLARDDIRSLLKILVDVVVQMKKVHGQFRVTEIYYDPAGRHAA